MQYNSAYNKTILRWMNKLRQNFLKSFANTVYKPSSMKVVSIDEMLRWKYLDQWVNLARLLTYLHETKIPTLLKHMSEWPFNNACIFLKYSFFYVRLFPFVRCKKIVVTSLIENQYSIPYGLHLNTSSNHSSSHTCHSCHTHMPIFVSYSYVKRLRVWLKSIRDT